MKSWSGAIGALAVGLDAGLLRVEAAGVCGSGVGSYARDLPPRAMGHENVGSVAAVGPAARPWGVQVGERVAWRNTFHRHSGLIAPTHLHARENLAAAAQSQARPDCAALRAVGNRHCEKGASYSWETERLPVMAASRSLS